MGRADDRTIVFSVPPEDLDATGRVILEAGRWCKTFYADGPWRPRGRMNDLISRRDVLDAIDKYILGKKEDETCEVRELLRLITKIYHMPSAQPEQIARDIATIIENEKDMRVILKNTEPEQTDCYYCHEDNDGFVVPIEKNCHAAIHGSVLYLKAKGWHGEAQIKYCPMCGRRLER